MNVLLILILASLTTAALALGAFAWAVRSGQFEDTTTPSMRVLIDDGPERGSRSRPTDSIVSDSRAALAVAPRDSNPASPKKLTRNANP